MIISKKVQWWITIKDIIHTNNNNPILLINIQIIIRITLFIKMFKIIPTTIIINTKIPIIMYIKIQIISIRMLITPIQIQIIHI